MNKLLSKLLLALGSVLLVLLATEVAIRVFDLFPDARAGIRQSGDDEAPAEAGTLPQLIHPFWGWVKRPGSRARFRSPIPIFADDQVSEWFAANDKANLFGFFSQFEDYRDLPEEDFVVGVFGGSVANNVTNIGGAALVSGIEGRHPALRGKVKVLNFGSGGWKQPQQVIVLTTMILLRVPLDVVVNLDGFNETALGGSDAQRGWHPLLPSRRHYGSLLKILSGSAASEEVLLMGEVVSSRRLAASLRRRAAASALLAASETAQAVLGRLAGVYSSRADRAEGELQERLEQGLAASVVVDLPDPCLTRDDGCGDLLADFWADGSVIMAQLARGIGAQYLHVLQPSQYTAGSKVLTDEEKEMAYRPENLWSRSARDGYPLLQARAGYLRAQGITFVDMSNLFAERTETIYRDPCCHFNELGNRILADAIAAQIHGPEHRVARRSTSSGAR